MTSGNSDVVPASLAETPEAQDATDGAEKKKRSRAQVPQRTALKKSDLYRSLWKGADELRGGMDASQYKDYVLTLLFVKYVSDRSERTLLEVPDGASFEDIFALRNDKEIGDKINTIVARLAEANDLRGVIDNADFNDENKLGRGKEMVDRLSKLVGIFESLDLVSNSAEGDDLLGDAYEYLMRHFATQSGKSKGQFYTPAEVSMVLARVVGIGPDTRPDQTVYDPACGSGALLLKAASESPRGMSVYGQEMDNATYALARMNMILHGYETAELWQGNTLASPHWTNKNGSLQTFDYAVVNPPFSWKAWMGGLDPENDLYHRFDDLPIPPAKNGDYGFLLHVLKSLKPTGKAAIILPLGVLFRGNSEGEIRRELIKRRVIKGVIGLPPNLFYGTGIAACVVVLDKESTAARSGIFMIDARRGFIKDGNKNRLRAQDIHKIVDVFTAQMPVEGYSRLVPFDVIECEDNNYNLNLARYIDSSPPEDIHDLDGHLNGGIPIFDIDALSSYWNVLPTLRDELFEGAGRDGYVRPTADVADVRTVIVDHADFIAFVSSTIGRFQAWREVQAPRLKRFSRGSHPKELIASLAEDLLDAFFEGPLIDPYDIYQHLMDYWAEAMQDDAYQVSQDGWNACLEGQPNNDLIPPQLVVQRYFPDEQAALETLILGREEVTQEREALDEEHSGEDGLLADARTEAGNLTKTGVKARLTEIKNDKAYEDEAAILRIFLDVLEKEATAKKAVKAAEAELEALVSDKFSNLTEDDVKALVVDDKWLSVLDASVRKELDRISHRLTDRIERLADRYLITLPELSAEAATLEGRVEEHLKRMGLEWT
jgi:type I restriction enzyme M protein